MPELQREVDELIGLVHRLLRVKELESEQAKEVIALCEKETQRLLKKCNKIVKTKKD